MTQPDEATMSSGPEKAHGDALEEAVEASPQSFGAESSDGQSSEESDADQDG